MKLDFFCNLWLYFFHLLAVNQAGLSVNHPHVIPWADLHRKGHTKGSNNTDAIRSYQHLDDKTLANISHCNVLFPAETKAHVANFISRLALLRPVSVRTFEVCHVTSVCAGFMADPPSVRCGSVASLDTLRPRPFLLRGASQASRDLGLQSVAGSATHVCRWPRFSIDTSMAGFYLPRIVGCLRGKGTQISSPNKFPHVGPQNGSSKHFGHDLSAENGCFEWTTELPKHPPERSTNSSES